MTVHNVATLEVQKTRPHIVIFMCFMVMLVSYLDRVTMSIAVLQMRGVFGWSATAVGWVLSSFFIGYLFFQVPAAALVNRFGGKAVLGVALLAWSVMTALTPIAAHYSFGLLLFIRALVGLFEGALAPGLYYLAARALARDQRSRGMVAIMAGTSLGTIASLWISSWVVVHYGWPVPFYSFGIFGIVFVPFWFALVPRLDSFVSADPQSPATAKKHIPWRQLFSSPAVVAIVFNHFCHNWVSFVLLSWLPSFFRMLHVNIEAAGILAGVPWIILLLTSNLGAAFADRMIRHHWTITRVRKTMQGVGMAGTAIFLIIAAIFPDPVVLMVCGCSALGMLGLTWSGVMPNHMDVAPRYADVLSSLSNTAGTLPGIVGVVLTGWLIDRTGSFASPLIMAAVVALAGGAVWLRWSSGEKLID
jgi:ACS family sodium-dependent inorganic phosphate cotransporter